jgi:predicted metalloenzyme YecM
MDKSIWCVEVPAPKPGRQYSSGWEHVECVIPHSLESNSSPSHHPEDGAPLIAFLEAHKFHPNSNSSELLNWNTDALSKTINADISLSFPPSSNSDSESESESDQSFPFGSTSYSYSYALPTCIKFHTNSLEQVIAYEKATDVSAAAAIPDSCPSIVREMEREKREKS